MSVRLNEKDTIIYSELSQNFYYELGYFTSSLNGKVSKKTSVEMLYGFDGIEVLVKSYKAFYIFLLENDLPLVPPLFNYLECSLERSLGYGN